MFNVPRDRPITMQEHRFSLTCFFGTSEFLVQVGVSKQLFLLSLFNKSEKTDIIDENTFLNHSCPTEVEYQMLRMLHPLDEDDMMFIRGCVEVFNAFQRGVILYPKEWAYLATEGIVDE